MKEGKTTSESAPHEWIEAGMSSSERSLALKRMHELYTENRLTDFTIGACGDSGKVAEFRVHRIVLASSEGFFSALVDTGSEMVEGRDGRVELPGTEPELLSLILDYVYGVSLRIEASKLVSLLGLAVRLQIAGLANQCYSILKRSLNERNCCQLYIAADKYGCPELRDAARDAVVVWLPTLARASNLSDQCNIVANSQAGHHTSSNAETYTSGSRRRAEERAKTFCTTSRVQVDDDNEDPNKKSHFTLLPAALAIQVLESDRIACDESVVFEAAAAWVLEQDRKESRGIKRGADGQALDHSHNELAANELLMRVRYPLMEATYLADVVKTHPAMQTPVRQALVTEAFEHLALRAAGRDRGSLAERIEESIDSSSCGLHYRTAPRKHRTLRCRAWPPRLSAGARLFEHCHSDAVAALCVCAGKVVSGSWDSTVRVWNADTGGCERTIEDHEGTVRALCDLNGRLVSASEDGNVLLFDPRSDWALTAVLADHASIVNALVPLVSAFSSSSSVVAQQQTIGADGTYSEYSGSPSVDAIGTTNSSRQMPPSLHLPASNATYSNHLTTSSSNQQQQHAEQLWHTQRPLRQRYTPPDDRFASGSDDGSIKIWSASDLRCQLTLHAGATVGILVLASLPGHLAAGSDDGSVRIFDTRTWTLVKKLDGQADEIWALTVIGDHLVTGSVDRTIQVFDIRDWSCVATCQHHHGPVYALTSLQNHLISASSDETIIPYNLDWEAESNELGANCSGVWCLTVHNDRLVTGGVNGRIRIWDR